MMKVIYNLFAGFGILGIVALFLILAVFGPIFTIWSLNHLFSTGIELTFWSWLSVFWIQMVLVGSKVSSVSKS